MKLVTDNGRWATDNNEMIFGKIVWLCCLDDIHLYHLIDEDGNTIKTDKPIKDYLVDD